jgi:hypothetical protein
MMASKINLESKKAKMAVDTLRQLREATTLKMQAATGLPKVTLNNVLRLLRDMNMIHVSSWDWTTSRQMVRVYKWGQGEDAPQPMIAFKDKNKPRKDMANFKPHADIAAAWLRNPI